MGSNYEWTFAELMPALGRLDALHAYLHTVTMSGHHACVAARLKSLIRVASIVTRDVVDQTVWDSNVDIANHLLAAFNGQPFEVYLNNKSFSNIARNVAPYVCEQWQMLPGITEMLPVPAIHPGNLSSLPVLEATLDTFQETFQKASDKTSQHVFPRIKSATKSAWGMLFVARTLVPIMDGRRDIVSHKRTLAQTVTQSLKAQYSVELKAI